MLKAKKVAFIFVILLFVLVVAQVPRTEASTNTSEEKALSFLSEVMRLDTSKYTASVTQHTQENKGKEHITIRLNGLLTGQIDGELCSSKEK